MNEQELKSHIAKLESRVDYLEAEFTHLDKMLREFGFEEGIKTLAESLDEAMQIEELFRHKGE